MIEHMFVLQHSFYNSGDKRNYSTKSGLDFAAKGKISLLADEDILHIIKSVYSDDLTDEYFARNTRRHPIWNSEAEFNSFSKVILNLLKTLSSGTSIMSVCMMNDWLMLPSA